MEIQLWRELLNPYELAVNELTLKFRHLIREHKENGLYSPIEQVSGRVKSISSILEKMQRKNIIFNDVEDQIEDIAGVRIICQFVEDIDRVIELLNNRNDIEVKAIKDYLNYIKESGYRSYHLIIYYNVQTIKGPQKIQVEIQIRTLAMDFWATVEHSLQYKYKENIPEHIRKRLSSAADAVLVLDNEMSSVRSEIMDAQNSFQIKENVVADILNNIQNLYKVANKREVSKIQDEFYKIYQTEDVDKLKRFNKQLDIISEGYRAQAITSDFKY
ncbi:MAG: GTP pyrophosphokinase family protein [Lachnotalea sp.]